MIRNYMTEPNAFILFGSDHLWATGLSVFLWIWLPLSAKKHLSKSHQNKLGILLGFLVMSNYIIWVILEILAGSFDLKLHLPFHLCRFANLAIPFVMIFKRDRLFQILYFWGMSGMIQGAITPDVTHGFPHFHFFRFIMGHNGMVLTLIYAIVVFELKPTMKGLWDSFLALNLFLLVAIIVNVSLDSNYFWICSKPLTASLLDYLGPWPWYILSAEIVALLHYFVAFFPIYYMTQRKII